MIENLIPKINITWSNPIISIQRSCKKYAVFNDYFKIVKDFTDYTDEKEAEQAARDWLKQYTNLEPEIVYPRIKSIKIN